MNPEVYIDKLISYIENNLSKGYTIESLKWALVQQGYSKVSINRAVKVVNEKLALKAPKLLRPPAIKKTEPILEEINGKPRQKNTNFLKTLKEFFKS